MVVRLDLSLRLSNSGLEYSPELVVICHCEAAWLSNRSWSEKPDDCSVGVRLTPVALSDGETLLGASGEAATATAGCNSGVNTPNRRIARTRRGTGTVCHSLFTSLRYHRPESLHRPACSSPEALPLAAPPPFSPPRWSPGASGG